MAAPVLDDSFCWSAPLRRRLTTLIQERPNGVVLSIDVIFAEYEFLKRRFVISIHVI